MYKTQKKWDGDVKYSKKANEARKPAKAPDVKRTWNPLQLKGGGSRSVGKMTVSFAGGDTLQQAPKLAKIAHHLRLAVHEGGSTDPKQNQKLRRAIKKALERDMSQDSIGMILHRCQLPQINFNTFLLQIRYQRKVYIICAVHTHNLADLQRHMMPILRRYGSNFAYVMHLFHNSALVEAMISYQAVFDFSDLEGTITRDANACKARSVEIVDYETGAVQFKCNPTELVDVCRAIDARGYRILHTEYSFMAKNPIELNWYEHEGYGKFLRRLQKVPEVESIYDNVRNLPEDKN